MVQKSNTKRNPNTQKLEKLSINLIPGCFLRLKNLGYTLLVSGIIVKHRNDFIGFFVG